MNFVPEPEPRWFTEDGRALRAREMTDTHLENVLLFAFRNGRKLILSEANAARQSRSIRWSARSLEAARLDNLAFEGTDSEVHFAIRHYPIVKQMLRERSRRKRRGKWGWRR